MSRVKISAPNAAYDGKVGDLQFSKGVYEGEAPDAIVNYCRATGYDVETLDGATDAGDGTQPASYDDMKVADLKDEIDRRNTDRDAEVQLAKSGTKAELIAALEADDEAQADAGDGNDENGAAQ